MSFTRINTYYKDMQNGNFGRNLVNKAPYVTQHKAIEL
jgi:hypothetical protein